MELLVESWVSRASAQQRRGRAGRVQPGTCYRCFTRRRFNAMQEQQVGCAAEGICVVLGGVLLGVRGSLPVCSVGHVRTAMLMAMMVRLCFQAPEVLRVPLEHLCLHIKSIGYADVNRVCSHLHPSRKERERGGGWRQTDRLTD